MTQTRGEILRDARGYIDPTSMEEINGVWVNRAAYDAAPHPIDCPGTDDGSPCEDDPQNPCKACFLYDDDPGVEQSRYWENPTD